MVEADDWRLTGQERFLTGVELHWAEWRTPRPEWDHDHCEFCWAKFGSESVPGALHFGYTTADNYRWICASCFADFHGHFEWQVVGQQPNA